MPVFQSYVVYFQGGEYECSLGNDSFQRILLGLDSTYLKLKPVAEDLSFGV
ncbi:hypothetical protein N5C36_03480 [Shewanella xiamenensis]|uniref:hypothetical protein n=1 Tax=Shewanella xiamenensis TaxID=332186 RepID=UPI00244C3DA1|nr:hypothetical protein [Shewanella xiamenensis]MDH1313154.1 hypothetical protein [Shewanella xiamenensis]